MSQNQFPQQNQENSQVSKYRAFSEFLIIELNTRYDLRPRPGPGRPPKNMDVNERPIKTTETKTTTIQPFTQSNEPNLVDKMVLTTFNVERELERVKIPIPLSGLFKNRGYKNQVSKWI